MCENCQIAKNEIGRIQLDLREQTQTLKKLGEDLHQLTISVREIASKLEASDRIVEDQKEILVQHDKRINALEIKMSGLSAKVLTFATIGSAIIVGLIQGLINFISK